MMILKYNCPSCGREIVSRYFMPGDTLTCPHCHAEIVVPQDAVSTNEEPNIVNPHEHPHPWPPHILDAGGVLRESIPIPIEPDTSTEPSRWNAYSVIKFALAFIVSVTLLSCVLGIIAAIIMIPFYSGADGVNEYYRFDLLKALGHIITFCLIIVPVALIYHSVVKRHHNKFFEALRLVGMPRKELNRYLLVGAGCVGIVLALYGLLFATGLDKNIPRDMPILDEFRHGYAGLIIFTLGALLAPASEELIFRGYIFQGLKESFGVRFSAIVVTALFVLMHAPQLGYSIIPLLFLCVVSVTLIWVRIKTDSLTKCIVIHQIYNTILIVILWLSVLLFGLDKMAA